MSKYTTEVRFICEEKAGLDESVGYNDVNRVIEQARSKIFNFDYPIFDETYKPLLEKKILKHYYTREICEETFGLWQLRLDSKMNDIMPYYNQLYKSELIQFNPLYDVDLTTTHDKQGTEIGLMGVKEDEAGTKVKNEIENSRNSENEVKAGSETNKSGNGETITTTGNTMTSVGTTNKGTSDTDDLKWQAYSDTPQGSLQNVDNNTYLTNATKNTDKENVKTENVENSNSFETGDETVTKDVNGNKAVSTNESGFKEGERKEDRNTNEANEREKERKSNRTVNNMEDYFENVVGKRGTASYSKMLNEFRDTFLNIDKMIIDELADLFFLLW